MPQKILQKAIDKDLPVCERINAIQNLTAKNFNDIKLIFEQIIEARKSEIEQAYYNLLQQQKKPHRCVTFLI